MNRVMATAIALALLAPAAVLGADKPIVVVFDVQDKSGAIETQVLDQLGDYLNTLLASKGFQVVPRSDMKARLREEKNASYKECYEQSCQIEIGRELAAQKTLSTQILKLGSQCKVTLSLYDLGKAATEAGATESGGCSEDEIVASLEKAVGALGTPAGGQALADQGWRIDRHGTEWAAVGFVPSFAQARWFLPGFAAQVVSLKWEHFYWTVLRGFFGSQGSGTPNIDAWFVGSELGYPLYLDEAGKHLLRFGVGLDVGRMVQDFGDGGTVSGCATPADCAVDALGLFAAPVVGYAFSTDIGFFFSLGADLRFWVAGRNKVDGADGKYPFTTGVSILLGWRS